MTRFTCKTYRNAVVTAVGLQVVGCVAPVPKGPVSDPNPQVSVPAMKRAVADKDMEVVPKLIKDLESDDPAIRFYAIYSLEELTGERNGYDYFAEAPDRAKAVERWKQWLKQQQARGSATEPAASQ